MSPWPVDVMLLLRNLPAQVCILTFVLVGRSWSAEDIKCLPALDWTQWEAALQRCVALESIRISVAFRNGDSGPSLASTSIADVPAKIKARLSSRFQNLITFA